MKGFEEAGVTGPGQGAELPGLPIDAWEVQGALMLFAHRKKHKDKDIHINLPHLEQNDLAMESAARDEWIETLEGKESLALRFRKYREQKENLHKRIDPTDTEALEELLGELTQK